MIRDVSRILTIYKEKGADIRIYAYELRHYKSIYNCDITHWI